MDNIGQKVLFEVPSTCALLFAGLGTYMSEGDPPVRQQLDNTKHQVRHWSKLYQWGAKNMPILIMTGTLAAAVAYQQTKEKLWLVGGATLLSIVPYTLLFMKKTNSQLNQILKDSGEAEELGSGEKETVVKQMKKWINLHRVRVLLAIGSAAMFFVAKQSSKTS